MNEVVVALTLSNIKDISLISSCISEFRSEVGSTIFDIEYYRKLFGKWLCSIDT